MKQLRFLHILFLIFSMAFMNSCTVVEGIFKAGMGFGIFIVVAIIALILFFVMRAGKNKS